jgi:glycosyltransferase involved in cell wall biosynthesis
MPVISIILSCYNGEKFLPEALDAIIHQNFRDWELIFVNDGSTDASESVARKYAEEDQRIKIVTKPNGGLNSARNFGVNYIHESSKALIFSDADDVMHSLMLMELYAALENDSAAGASYCNYELIDEEGKKIKRENSSNRYVPTRFWVRPLNDLESHTPFYSIYTWTPMVEPMTLLRKDCFMKYDRWDEINFPKGDFGESIPLFGEIALNHSIVYVDKVLYSYRKHGGQITSDNSKRINLQEKIDRIWQLKVLRKPEYKKRVSKARVFRKYRLPLYYFLNGHLKHELRFSPLSAIGKIITYGFKWLLSIPFFLNEKKSVNT